MTAPRLQGLLKWKFKENFNFEKILSIISTQRPDDFLTKGCRHRTGVLLIPFSDISSYFFRGGGPPNIFGPPFLFSPFLSSPPEVRGD